MSKYRLGCALALAIVGATAIAEAQGKPGTVPVGPPTTPVTRPSVPPSNPPTTLIQFVCSILPVPYLCD
jgi:hypothetical protein